MGTHEVFLAATKLLNLPHHCGEFRRIRHSANRSTELGRVGVVRYRDDDLDVVSRRTALELRFDLDHELNARALVALDNGLGPDEWLDLRRETVAHQLELPVRRDERDRTVILKTREAHTLVELYVLHFDCLAA